MLASGVQMPCQCDTPRKRARCVYWIDSTDLVETNDATGEVRACRGCFTDVFLRWIKGTVKAQQQVAVSSQQLRDEFARAAQVVLAIAHQPPQQIEAQPDLPLLTEH